MAACLRDFAAQVHEDTGIFLMFVPGGAWPPPGVAWPALQFDPYMLSDYLFCEAPGLSPGAAARWIWTAAEATSEAAMINALRNLIGLLPEGFVRENCMDEAAV